MRRKHRADGDEPAILERRQLLGFDQLRDGISPGARAGRREAAAILAKIGALESIED